MENPNEAQFLEQIDLNATLEGLKSQIGRKIQMPSGQIRITFKNKVLENDKMKLSDYGLSTSDHTLSYSVIPVCSISSYIVL